MRKYFQLHRKLSETWHRWFPALPGSSLRHIESHASAPPQRGLLGRNYGRSYCSGMPEPVLRGRPTEKTIERANVPLRHWVYMRYANIMLMNKADLMNLFALRLQIARALVRKHEEQFAVPATAPLSPPEAPEGRSSSGASHSQSHGQAAQPTAAGSRTRRPRSSADGGSPPSSRESRGADGAGGGTPAASAGPAPESTAARAAGEQETSTSTSDGDPGYIYARFVVDLFERAEEQVRAGTRKTSNAAAAADVGGAHSGEDEQRESRRSHPQSAEPKVVGRRSVKAPFVAAILLSEARSIAPLIDENIDFAEADRCVEEAMQTKGVMTMDLEEVESGTATLQLLAEIKEHMQKQRAELRESEKAGTKLTSQEREARVHMDLFGSQ